MHDRGEGSARGPSLDELRRELDLAARDLDAGEDTESREIAVFGDGERAAPNDGATLFVGVDDQRVGDHREGFAARELGGGAVERRDRARAGELRLHARERRARALGPDPLVAVEEFDALIVRRDVEISPREVRRDVGDGRGQDGRIDAQEAPPLGPSRRDGAKARGLPAPARIDEVGPLPLLLNDADRVVGAGARELVGERHHRKGRRAGAGFGRIGVALRLKALVEEHGLIAGDEQAHRNDALGAPLKGARMPLEEDVGAGPVGHEIAWRDERRIGALVAVLVAFGERLRVGERHRLIGRHRERRLDDRDGAERVDRADDHAARRVLRARRRRARAGARRRRDRDGPRLPLLHGSEPIRITQGMGTWIGSARLAQIPVEIRIEILIERGRPTAHRTALVDRLAPRHGGVIRGDTVSLEIM